LESTELTGELIDDLLKIEVIKKDFKPNSKSKIRGEVFGNDFWIMPVKDLSEKIYGAIKGKVDKSIKVISENHQIDEDDINFLRFGGVSKFTTEAKIGDQIILNWESKGMNRHYVYPPATILRIEKVDKITFIFYDNKKENKRMSWSKFKALTKNFDLELKTDKPRRKKLSTSDINYLIPIWN
jgi:hypothetical protein